MPRGAADIPRRSCSHAEWDHGWMIELDVRFSRLLCIFWLPGGGVAVGLSGFAVRSHVGSVPWALFSLTRFDAGHTRATREPHLAFRAADER